MFRTTIYKVQFGGRPGQPETTRYFPAHEQADASACFAAAVVDLDCDDAVSAAWACMSRMPDRIFPNGSPLAVWTKVSDERPNAPGYATPEEAENWHGRGDAAWK